MNMNYYISTRKVFFSFLATAVFLWFNACTGEPAPRQDPVSALSLDQVTGKQFRLTEIRVPQGESLIFDREKLIEEGFEDIFTLTFDAERISGRGAPNRYSAPYELGSGKSIKIGLIAGTLMAPLRSPEKLQEAGYFSYLQNVSQWNLQGWNLELSTKTAEGREALMIYVLE
ncbi:MAG: META domain-containing protein [Treponema sp.]|jgi:heat shock protein HslJ|nr:META domain-containing protein [Treponema sp.]